MNYREELLDAYEQKRMKQTDPAILLEGARTEINDLRTMYEIDLAALKEKYREKLKLKEFQIQQVKRWIEDQDDVKWGNLKLD